MNNLLKLSLISVVISSGPLLAYESNDIYDAVIIGGGLSGLNAARTIHNKNPNAKICVLEARGRTGGRTYTKDGVELGGEFIDREQEFAKKTLAELGLELEGLTLDGDVIGIKDGNRIELQDLKDSIESLTRKLENISKSTQNAEFTEWNPNSQHFHYSGIHEKLADLDANEKAILKSIVRDECATNLENASLGSVIGMIDRLEEYGRLIMLKTWTPNFLLSLYDYQYRIKGGTAALTSKLVESLPKGAVMTNMPVQWVTKQDNSYKIISGNREFKAKNVIISAPFSVLHNNKILDDKSLAISDELRFVIDYMTYGTNAKIIVPCQQNKTTNYFLDLDQGTSGWSNPKGISFIECNPSQELANKRMKQAKSIFGAKVDHDTKPIIQDWVKEEFSLGSWSNGAAGRPFSSLNLPSDELTGLSKMAGPFNDGTLFFIGEHTCDGRSPVKENNDNPIETGYMQSALYSGKVVGDYVGQRLKK